MPQGIGPELQYLLDRQAIRDCAWKYTQAVDRHDVELIPRVYHPDATDDHGRFVGDVAGFVEWVNGVHEATEEGHQHNVTTHLCTIDGDVAHAESYLLWALRNKGGQTVMLGAARYIDRLERRDGEWRIALRRTLTEMRSRSDATAFGRLAAALRTGRWDRSDPTFQRPLRLSPEQEQELRAKDAAAGVRPDSFPGTSDRVKKTMTANDGQAALQYLLDRQAILDCINTYCRALDRHDRALLASVFHPDAIDNHGPFVGRVPEFLDFAEAATSGDIAAHTHNTTSHIVEIEGDVAHAESYVIIALRHKDGKTVTMGGGRYLDRLERRDGVWKIALRRVVMDWRMQTDGSIFNANDGYGHGVQDKTDLSYMRPLDLSPEQKQKLGR